MKHKNILLSWLCIIPAFVVAICIMYSLHGYEPPEYIYGETIDQFSEELQEPENALVKETDHAGEDEELSSDPASLPIELATLDQGVYKDGTYDAMADCYDEESEELDQDLNFDYTITLSVSIAQDRIIEISNIEGIPSAYEPVYDEKNDVYINMAAQGMGPYTGVVEQILTTQDLHVDVVSGATYSSRAIMTAVRHALEDAQEP